MTIMNKMKKNLVALTTAGALALAASCGLQPRTGGTGGTGSSNKITCYEAGLEQEGGLVFTWQAEDTGGSNHFYIHKVEECGDGEYCFTNGDKVNNYMGKHDPVPPSVWKAWRPYLDDQNDLRVFTQEDPFIVGYLPWTPKAPWGWKSEHADYDWRCEDGDTGETNSLENCIGLSQLDKAFTLNTLREGQDYLARFIFGSAVNGNNWIIYCNQKIFKYEK